MAPGACICLTACDVQPDPVVAGRLSITLASSKVLYMDLIIGADIVKSTLQKGSHGAR